MPSVRDTPTSTRRRNQVSEMGGIVFEVRISVLHIPSHNPFHESSRTMRSCSF